MARSQADPNRMSRLLLLLPMVLSGCMAPVTTRLDAMNAQLRTSNRLLDATHREIEVANRKLDETNARLKSTEELLKRFPLLKPTAEAPADQGD